MIVDDKGLRFALSACGVDPATVKITHVIHDAFDVVCNPGDEHAVHSAIKIWQQLKCKIAETYPGIQKLTDLMNTKN